MMTYRSSVSPQGRISLTGDDPAVPPSGIAVAFDRGTGHGLLHLGAVELGTTLPPSLSYWRELGRSFVGAACAAVNPLDPAAVVIPEPDSRHLEALASSVPPMLGAELVSVEMLHRLWEELGRALTERAAEHETGVQGFLEASHSIWHTAGRVCLHLAENKRDPELPFAFIATYARPRPDRAELQYVPLSRALQEYAGARNKEKLLALLTPLKRAAESSALIRELVDTSDIYHPLAWTAEEAHALLCEAELLERAGLVRWRTSRARSRRRLGWSDGARCSPT